MSKDTEIIGTDRVYLGKSRKDWATSVPSDDCVVEGVSCVFNRTFGVLSNCTNVSQMANSRGGGCGSRYPKKQETKE